MTSDAPSFDDSNESLPTIDEVQLGDATGDDPKLRAFLDSLEQGINRDAPGRAGYPLIEFLRMCANSTAQTGWSLLKATVRKGANTFSNLHPDLVRARSEARERDALSESRADQVSANAERIRAEAELVRAQADLVLAEAAEERQRTKRKDALLREMRKRGIDFLAEQQGSVLRICFTKTDVEESDSKDS